MRTRVETDLHVRVDVLMARRGWSIDERRELEEFVRVIKNHRDLDGYDARLAYNLEYRCSHCGRKWETWGDSPDPDDPDYDPYLPVCCEAAQQEYRAMTERAG